MLNSFDSGLDQQIAAVFHNNPHLQQRDLLIRTDAGHVTLKGRVKSFFEKQMAQEALKRVQGVESVDNQLQVTWND
jgi:osmotically-inducible protein OsmY